MELVQGIRKIWPLFICNITGPCTWGKKHRWHKACYLTQSGNSNIQWIVYSDAKNCLTPASCGLLGFFDTGGTHFFFAILSHYLCPQSLPIFQVISNTLILRWYLVVSLPLTKYPLCVLSDWLKTGWNIHSVHLSNIHSVYLWVSLIIWDIYWMYKVVSYNLSDIASVTLSDYQYNVGYPISAWETIQYLLADAIRLARHHRNINLIANGLCISGMMFE